MTSEILIYQNPDGNIKIDVRLENETVWLTQAQMGQLFGKDKRTIQHHYQTILNFFDNRSTNASAESFNAKIKAFRSQFRGVRNVKFFLFRLSKIYA